MIIIGEMDSRSVPFFRVGPWPIGNEKSAKGRHEKHGIRVHFHNPTFSLRLDKCKMGCVIMVE
jgi:hypothetical protein